MKEEFSFTNMGALEMKTPASPTGKVQLKAFVIFNLMFPVGGMDVCRSPRHTLCVFDHCVFVTVIIMMVKFDKSKMMCITTECCFLQDLLQISNHTKYVAEILTGMSLLAVV